MGAEKNGKDVGFSKKNLGPPTPGLVSFFIINIKLYINSHTLLLLSLLFDSIHSAQDIYENVCMTIKMVAVVIKVSLNQFVRLDLFFWSNQFTNQTCSDFIMSLSIQNTEGEITLEV